MHSGAGGSGASGGFASISKRVTIGLRVFDPDVACYVVACDLLHNPILAHATFSPSLSLRRFHGSIEEAYARVTATNGTSQNRSFPFMVSSNPLHVNEADSLWLKQWNKPVWSLANSKVFDIHQ